MFRSSNVRVYVHPLNAPGTSNTYWVWDNWYSTDSTYRQQECYNRFIRINRSRTHGCSLMVMGTDRARCCVLFETPKKLNKLHLNIEPYIQGFRFNSDWKNIRLGIMYSNRRCHLYQFCIQLHKIDIVTTIVGVVMYIKTSSIKNYLIQSIFTLILSRIISKYKFSAQFSKEMCS